MALKNNPGLVASGALHSAGLVLLLVSFSRAPKFDDALESVPVEMISASDLNQIAAGEKTAAPLPVPQRRADRVAAVAEPKPEPPLAEAKKDVPLPPAPNKPQDDPGEEDKPVPTPPQRVAALPPAEPTPVPVPRPEPAPPVRQAEPTPPVRPAPEPPKPVAEKPAADKPAEKPPLPDAEALEPKPVPRPKVEPKKEAKAEPAPKPMPTPVVRPPEKKQPVKEAKLELPKPPEPPKKPEPRFKPDELAKLLEDKKDQKPAPRPKSGSDAKEPPQRTFDPHNISALLDHEAPQRKASTGQKLTQVASLGAPNANAAVLSPSMMGQLAEFFTTQYLSCWTYFGLASSANYVPAVRLHLLQDGTLVGQPQLTNPPSDPNQRSLADSAVRAVQKCNPLKVPDRFAPFYDRWRDQIIRFDQKALL